jgi:hypothetical protein
MSNEIWKKKHSPLFFLLNFILYIQLDDPSLVIFINLFRGSRNFYLVYSVPFCRIKNFEQYFNVVVKSLEHWNTQIVWMTCFLQVAPSVVCNLYSLEY